MNKEADKPKPAKTPDLEWIGASVIFLGIGSLGPAVVYEAVTDARYFDKVSGWGMLALPLAVWLLTGGIVMGLTAIWFGGITRDSLWQQHMYAARDWWCKLGLRLLGIGIVIALSAVLFGGVGLFLATLDRGTVLIAFLLLMILLALWRIGNEMKRR